MNNEEKKEFWISAFKKMAEDKKRINEYFETGDESLIEGIKFHKIGTIHSDGTLTEYNSIEDYKLNKEHEI